MADSVHSKMDRASYHELDCQIADLASMAQLAELQLHAAVGELGYKDGKCIEPPDAEALRLAVFAVSQTATMTQKLEQWFQDDGGAAERIVATVEG